MVHYRVDGGITTTKHHAIIAVDSLDTRSPLNLNLNRYLYLFSDTLTQSNMHTVKSFIQLHREAPLYLQVILSPSPCS